MPTTQLSSRASVLAACWYIRPTTGHYDCPMMTMTTYIPRERNWSDGNHCIYHDDIIMLSHELQLLALTDYSLCYVVAWTAATCTDRLLSLLCCRMNCSYLHWPITLFIMLSHELQLLALTDYSLYYVVAWTAATCTDRLLSLLCCRMNCSYLHWPITLFVRLSHELQLLALTDYSLYYVVAWTAATCTDRLLSLLCCRMNCSYLHWPITLFVMLSHELQLLALTDYSLCYVVAWTAATCTDRLLSLLCCRMNCSYLHWPITLFMLSHELQLLALTDYSLCYVVAWTAATCTDRLLSLLCCRMNCSYLHWPITLFVMLSHELQLLALTDYSLCYVVAWTAATCTDRLLSLLCCRMNCSYLHWPITLFVMLSHELQLLALTDYSLCYVVAWTAATCTDRLLSLLCCRMNCSYLHWPITLFVMLSHELQLLALTDYSLCYVVAWTAATCTDRLLSLLCCRMNCSYLHWPITLFIMLSHELQLLALTDYSLYYVVAWTAATCTDRLLSLLCCRMNCSYLHWPITLFVMLSHELQLLALTDYSLYYVVAWTAATCTDRLLSLLCCRMNCSYLHWPITLFIMLSHELQLLALTDYSLCYVVAWTAATCTDRLLSLLCCRMNCSYLHWPITLFVMLSHELQLLALTDYSLCYVVAWTAATCTDRLLSLLCCRMNCSYLHWPITLFVMLSHELQLLALTDYSLCYVVAWTAATCTDRLLSLCCRMNCSYLHWPITLFVMLSHELQLLALTDYSLCYVVAWTAATCTDRLLSLLCCRMNCSYLHWPITLFIMLSHELQLLALTDYSLYYVVTWTAATCTDWLLSLLCCHMNCSYLHWPITLFVWSHRIRLQEGFRFSHANAGIVDMVLEVDMKVCIPFVSVSCGSWSTVARR